MWFEPHRISVNNIEATREIYGVNANTKKSQVYTAYSHFFKVPSLVTIIEKKPHAFRRRINVRALTVNTIEGLEELIYKNCATFYSTLVETEGKGSKSSAQTRVQDSFLSHVRHHGGRDLQS